jgi:small subunit ribosomal protein S20
MGSGSFRIQVSLERRGSAIPNTRSAKKQLRQNLRRRRRNDLRKSAIRYWRRTLQSLIKEGKLEEAVKVFPNFQKAVDKAAQRRAIHPNRAARLKARMARRLHVS